MLTAAGWKDLGSGKWRRPGKKDGISATLGKVAKGIFYSFSSNGYPFESGKGYTAFQVLGLLKFNGDFNATAKSVASLMPQPEPKGQQYEKRVKKIPETELAKIIESVRINTSKKVERPPIILSIREREATQTVDRRAFTLGNFSCITGKAKAKKTFLVTMLTAVILSKVAGNKFIPTLQAGKDGILYFDTEQGDYDSWMVATRVEQMGGVINRNRLQAFSLRAYTPLERCQIIEAVLQQYGKDSALTVIDGIADLANAVNDEEESTRVVSLLMRWSKEYNLHIMTVLHQNKKDDFVRGFLGTIVMMKSEIIISIANKGDYSEISCERSRSQPFNNFVMVVKNGIPAVGDNQELANKEEKDLSFNQPTEQEKEKEKEKEKDYKLREKEIREGFNTGDELF
jgi:hypothetical protein